MKVDEAVKGLSESQYLMNIMGDAVFVSLPTPTGQRLFFDTNYLLSFAGKLKPLAFTKYVNANRFHECKPLQVPIYSECVTNTLACLSVPSVSTLTDDGIQKESLHFPPSSPTRMFGWKFLIGDLARCTTQIRAGTVICLRLATLRTILSRLCVCGL